MGFGAKMPSPYHIGMFEWVEWKKERLTLTEAAHDQIRAIGPRKRVKGRQYFIYLEILK